MRKEADTGDHHSAASPEEPDGTRLRRAVTGRLLFLFILGDVLGAGIYALFGVIAGEVGGAVWVPMLVALVLALLTAASYAELVTKYPRAGGSAVFADRAYRSPLVSFLVGYCMLAAGVTSAAASRWPSPATTSACSSTCPPSRPRWSSSSWWPCSTRAASRSRCGPTS